MQPSDQTPITSVDLQSFLKSIDTKNPSPPKNERPHYLQRALTARKNPSPLRPPHAKEVKSMNAVELKTLLQYAEIHKPETLQSINMQELQNIPQREVIATLCKDGVFEKLSERQRDILATERFAWQVENKRIEIDFNALEQLPAQWCVALSPRFIAGRCDRDKVNYLNRFWEQLPRNYSAKIALTVHPEFYERLDANFLLKALALFPEKHPLTEQKSLLEKRAEIQKHIAQFLTALGGFNDLKFNEVTQLLNLLFEAEKKDHIHTLSVKKETYLEACIIENGALLPYIHDFRKALFVAARFFKTRSLNTSVVWKHAQNPATTVSFKKREHLYERGNEAFKEAQHLAAAIGSFYPVLNQQRQLDPITHDCKILVQEHLLIGSFAVGSGWDRALKTATHTNRIFTQYLLKMLTEQKREPLAAYMEALTTIQAEIVKLDTTASHIGLVGIGLEGRVNVFASFIGDLELHFIRRKKLRATRIAGNSPGGASLKPGRFGATLLHYPDLKDFRLASFSAKNGDLLVVLSSGISKNLSPDLNGTSPRAAIEFIGVERILDDRHSLNFFSTSTHGWEQTEFLKKAKTLFVEKTVLEIAKMSNFDPDLMRTMLVGLASTVVDKKLRWAEDNPKLVIPKIRENVGSVDQPRYLWGELDHFLCAVIQC